MTSESTQNLLFERHGGTAVLTLNRPDKGNAFTDDMKRGLISAWTEVRENPDIRVAIITGAGSRHFCTGADVTRTAREGRASGGRGPLSEEVRLSARQNRVWKPVISAVNGMAVGAGLHFIVDSDIVLAAERAEFLDAHANVGFVGAIENIGLAKRLPLGTALRMTLMGKAFRLTAKRAYDLGLVDEVFPADRLMDEAMDMAEVIGRNSPTAMSLSQQAIWHSLEAPYREALEYGWALVRLHWSHPDFIEGPRAFAEKRAPQWRALGDP